MSLRGCREFIKYCPVLRATSDDQQIMFINHTLRQDTNHLPELNTNPTVIGPDGYVMTIHDLPPRNTKRWVTRRKAQVVYAVQAGLITLEDACERYSLTPEEFASWQTMIKKHGIAGLRVTHLTKYRKSDKAGFYDESEA